MTPKPRPGDGASVDELDLSVRTSNVLATAGVRTIGQLRAADTTKLKHSTRVVQKQLAAELDRWDKTGAGAAWEKRERQRRMEAARAALAALAPEERVQVFRDVGACACAMMAREAVRSPGVAIGALIGGVLGGALAMSSSVALPRTTTPTPADYCPDCRKRRLWGWCPDAPPNARCGKKP